MWYACWLIGLVSRSLGTSNNQKSPGGRYSSQASIKPIISHPRQSQDTNSSGPIGKESREVRRAVVPNAITQVQASKPNDSQPQTAMLAANHSVVGVYSSSSDPVHVPSPDSRSAAAAGAIKHEFGAVGVRRQSSENKVKLSSAHSSSFSHSHLGKDGISSRESLRPSTSKSDQSSQTTFPESIVPSRSFLSNQYNGRLHQQAVGHQKGRLIRLEMLSENLRQKQLWIMFSNCPYTTRGIVLMILSTWGGSCRSSLEDCKLWKWEMG